MNPAELFQANLELVDRLIDRVCRRARLFGADAEDFASSVRLALMEDDYAILRSYRGQSSLATFLTIVIRRLLADERIQAYGRWRPSTAARQMGETAILLEMLLVHDRRSLDEALPIIRAHDGEVTREALETMAARLPERALRARPVELNGTVSETVASHESTDERAIEADRRRLAAQAGRVVRETMAGMSLEDRSLLRFRFASSMSVADISRVLRVPQRPLYRRLDVLLEKLRRALTAAGIDARIVAELFDSSTGALDFDLEIGKTGDPRQTMQERLRGET